MPRKSKSRLPIPESASEEAMLPERPFPIVAIGASAGGLEAYSDFFHALPANTGMAFVLIQHLDPKHHSLLAEILSKVTRMPVDEVQAGVRIRPNRVYVIPPDAFMAIADGAFVLTPRSKGPGQHLSVNFFMRSLAEERKSGAIGIILSGTGADGSAGLESIKAEGGLTFAQDPATAKFDGMPRSAIDSGCVDFILPPQEIARELQRIQRHPYVRPEPQVEAIQEGEAEVSGKKAFSAILNHLHQASGVDFSQYRPNTIHRRALRRMVILKLDSLGEYARYLAEHPEERLTLYDDVLIPVTSFFRDFEAFEALKTQVYPAIVKDKSNKGTIRMWAPGCSTGEETYSLAMTLLEFLGDKASSFQVQIFGTDLNEKCIQKARAGVYRESIAEEISPERLQRFFVKVDEGYRVNKAVRDMCVFARQNLASDPPFSQMNLVVCRNLLIYIQPVLQKKILPILHYALRPNGFLFLGSSESVSAFPDLFAPIDKKYKIYSKKTIASRLHYDFSQTYSPTRSDPSFNPAEGSGKGMEFRNAIHALSKSEADVQAEADRIVLNNHAPAGVVVNSRMEVVQFRGRTTPYLEQSHGKPSLNVLKLARNGLAMELRMLLSAAAKKGNPVRKNGVVFDSDGHKRVLNLSVSPLGEKSSPGNRFYLVLFEDVTPEWQSALATTSRGRKKGDAKSPDDFRKLKEELTGARDALRAAVESEDSLKEEFQSANEEILSANEELQSTNEELETSKEELQSSNEELNTVNAELRHKNSELHELTNDISNLLNSTRIPIVMLDRHLHIRRLTPSANRLLKAVPSDIGRPIGDLKLNIELPSLESAIAGVLESLHPWEQDVRDLQGHWHSLSILPYQTQDNKIDGVVLALQDIDAIKSASEQLRKSAEFFRGIIDTVREPLLVLDAEFRVIELNQSFQSTFKVSPLQTIGQPLFRLDNGQWNIPVLRGLLADVLERRQSISDFEVEHDFESLGRRHLLLNARTLVQQQDAQPMILLAMEDITERKLAQEKSLELQQHLRQQWHIYRTTLSSITDFAYTFDREGRFVYVNEPLLDLWGLKLEDAVGKNFFDLNYPPELAKRLQEQIEQVFTTGQKCTDETAYTNPKGKAGYYEYAFNPVFAPDGAVELVAGSTHDLTERKLSEAALIQSERLAAAGRLAAALAHEINNPLQAVTNLMILLGQSPTMDLQDQEFAKMAAQELDRVVHLVRQSLGFYRESTFPAQLDIQQEIESVLTLYARQIKQNQIRISKRFRLDDPLESYPGDVRQVFSTLLLNAMDAMPQGGHLVIRASRSSLHKGNRAVPGVRIAVADNGSGIAAKNLARIFEPFFTTKGDRGTGLGLWVAQGIMQRLSGSMRVRSSTHPARRGTIFSVFFPDKTPRIA